ncbi:hypothetical protein QG37_00704 [Candidozyma auris]|nr:hypothetical protein QG37_00704 [[Candida] auris]
MIIVIKESKKRGKKKKKKKKKGRNNSYQLRLRKTPGVICWIISSAISPRVNIRPRLFFMIDNSSVKPIYGSPQSKLIYQYH